MFGLNIGYVSREQACLLTAAAADADAAAAAAAVASAAVMTYDLNGRHVQKWTYL